MSRLAVGEREIATITVQVLLGDPRDCGRCGRVCWLIGDGEPAGAKLRATQVTAAVSAS